MFEHVRVCGRSPPLFCPLLSPTGLLSSSVKSLDRGLLGEGVGGRNSSGISAEVGRRLVSALVAAVFSRDRARLIPVCRAPSAARETCGKKGGVPAENHYVGLRSVEVAWGVLSYRTERESEWGSEHDLRHADVEVRGGQVFRPGRRRLPLRKLAEELLYLL